MNNDCGIQRWPVTCWSAALRGDSLVFTSGQTLTFVWPFKTRGTFHEIHRQPNIYVCRVTVGHYLLITNTKLRRDRAVQNLDSMSTLHINALSLLLHRNIIFLQELCQSLSLIGIDMWLHHPKVLIRTFLQHLCALITITRNYSTKSTSSPITTTLSTIPP